MSIRAQTLKRITKSEFLDFKVFPAPLGPLGPMGRVGVMAWSQVTPGCNIREKKSSVLGCFRDTFVMCDIFGSKKILRPALVLNSTIHTLPPRPLKILAH